MRKSKGLPQRAIICTNVQCAQDWKEKEGIRRLCARMPLQQPAALRCVSLGLCKACAKCQMLTDHLEFHSARNNVDLNLVLLFKKILGSRQHYISMMTFFKAAQLLQSAAFYVLLFLLLLCCIAHLVKMAVCYSLLKVFLI